MCRTAVFIDVKAVWGNAYRNNFCAKLPQHIWRSAIGCTIRAIDDDFQPFEIRVAR